MKKTPIVLFWSGAAALSLAAWFTACQSTPAPAAAEIKNLQGCWEGDGREGNGPRFKSSITIAGNSLHCFRDTNYWFTTTITLPAGTNPQQLRATIKAASHKSHTGQVVAAIVKIEDGTLTLAASDHGVTPKNFDDETDSLFVLRKVKPPKRNTEPPKTN